MVLEQDSTIRSFMLKWLFFLLITFNLSTELFADYFKWEILVSENGYGTESHTILLIQQKEKSNLQQIWLSAGCQVFGPG